MELTDIFSSTCTKIGCKSSRHMLAIFFILGPQVNEPWVQSLFLIVKRKKTRCHYSYIRLCQFVSTSVNPQQAVLCSLAEWGGLVYEDQDLEQLQRKVLVLSTGEYCHQKQTNKQTLPIFANMQRTDVSKTMAEEPV